MKRSGQNILRAMFGLDYRSLALLRMGLAALVLCVLYVSAWDLRAFYTDEGVLPRSQLLYNFGPVFSFHMASGSFWFEAALFGFQAVLALLMFVGYRTKIVTIASYALLCSMQARNPILIFGMHIALRVCFFWAMFLPLGARFSLDAAMGRTRRPGNDTYLGIPGLAYIIQLALIYIISGLLKTGPTWLVDHTAIYYAVSTEFLQRPAGAWLSQYDRLTTWMTEATLYLEEFGPILFVLPFWNGWGRLLAFVIFAAFQIGINVTMEMGLFGPVMIGVMFALLPAEFWTKMAEPAGRWIARALQRIRVAPAWLGRAGSSRSDGEPSNTPWWKRGDMLLLGVRDGVVFVLIAYVAIWNLDTIPGRPALIPVKYKWIALDTGLDQLFNLFTPNPSTDDGWFVIKGVLQNGQSVNAFTGERKVSYGKPASVANTYRDQLWGAYLLCLWYPDCSQHLEPFALYLGREWNKTHSGPEHITSLQITFMAEQVPPPHQPREPAVPNLLWTEKLN